MIKKMAREPINAQMEAHMKGNGRTITITARERINVQMEAHMKGTFYAVKETVMEH